MPGHEVPFPLKLNLSGGTPTGLKDRLGKGLYKAFEIGGYVKVHASNIAMSGLHPRAELVYVPTLVAPIRYELHVFETDAQLLNLVLGSADAQFRSNPQTGNTVVVVDSDGAHEVAIEHP